MAAFKSILRFNAADKKFAMVEVSRMEIIGAVALFCQVWIK
jgi:hypothetical protein